MQKEKGISTLIGIIIIIIVAVVLFGGVFAYQYFSTKANNQFQVQNQQQTVNKPTNNSQLTNQIAGWKTYTNNQYGFEVKYPNKWQILQTWRPTVDGINGVVLGYRGEGDYTGINVDIIFDKNKLKEFSGFKKKYLVEKNGVSYFLFPNNVSDDEFNLIVSTFKFSK